MEQIIIELEKLCEPAKPLEFIDATGTHKEEGQAIIDKIKEVMETDKSIIALSAPQIGVEKRIFCIRFNETIKTFINPIITKKGNYKIAVETCASMPGKEILITRPEDLTVIYYNDQFKYEDNKLLGAAARIFDQQANLLDGILPNDLGLVSDIAQDGSFADLTEEEVSQVLDIYKQFIAAKSNALEKAIQQDETINTVYNRLKATEKVINGEIKLVEDSPARPMNREQRRAAEKLAKQIKNKKAGK